MLPIVLDGSLLLGDLMELSSRYSYEVQISIGDKNCAPTRQRSSVVEGFWVKSLGHLVG